MIFYVISVLLLYHALHDGMIDYWNVTSLLFGGFVPISVTAPSLVSLTMCANDRSSKTTAVICAPCSTSTWKQSEVYVMTVIFSGKFRHFFRHKKVQFNHLRQRSKESKESESVSA